MEEKMDNFRATMIAEGVFEATKAEQANAWSHLIKTGLCWRLQGFFGRTASRLIEEGVFSRTGEILIEVED